MTIKAIAWDIDGTLVDSEPLHHQALLAGTAHFGTDLSDIPEDRFRGVHMDAVFEEVKSRLPARLGFERWIEPIRNHYIANAGELQPIEGVLAAMNAAADYGLLQVCVSNSGRNIVDANIAALGIADKLRFSISINDVRNGKPDPEPYLTAAEQLQLAPAEIIAIEDSLTGAISAHAAGMKVVGYGLTAETGHSSIDHYLIRYTELPAILRGYM
ncbi:HAD family hydrolase [Brucella grignonensis]|uniref:HAD hydrolase, IA, variant 3 family protein n=1 Tax=Brucella grignonensis TaxID=94627 RepID=A0A256F185_9HYPH|nr:HAD family phosphatase [Brucella grignonensis]NKB84600.1 HAD family phosphatase [Brucella grignonensis]OYR08607.1 HAD hydrolase, IA, variant 3 family protein [Brucella grignonensis]